MKKSIIRKGYFPLIKENTIEHLMLDSNNNYYLTALSMQDGLYDLAQQKEYAFSEDYVATNGENYKIHSCPSNRYRWNEYEDLLAEAEGRKPNIMVYTEDGSIITAEECLTNSDAPGICSREEEREFWPICQGVNCPYRYIKRD